MAVACDNCEKVPSIDTRWVLLHVPAEGPGRSLSAMMQGMASPSWHYEEKIYCCIVCAETALMDMRLSAALEVPYPHEGAGLL